jgi:outer membrane protein
MRRLLLSALLLSLVVPAAAQRRRASSGPLVVAVVTDGESERYTALQALIEQEVGPLMGEGRVVFPEAQVRRGDFTAESIRAALEAAYADDEVDAVIAMGALTTEVLAAWGAPAHPTILPVVLHAQRERLPRDESRSGRHNLTYILGAVDLERDFRRFQELGRFDRIDALLQAGTASMVDAVAEELAAAGRAADVEVRLVRTETTVEAILAGIPEDSQAVYLGPLIQLDDAAYAELMAALQARQVAAFSPLGPDAVEAGALASATPDEDWLRRARRVALGLQRIARGEDPARFSIAFEPREQLVINMATARAVGVYPPWRILTEAELVGQTRSTPARTYTLPEALREAVERNYDLAAQDDVVEAGRQDVAAARAPLLPSIAIGATGVVIDEDRAAGFGSPGQLSASGTLSATQVLFSELAWTAFRAQERIQEGIEQERETARLDVILEAANAYFNVLRALTAEAVQRDNLRVSRSNLALAEVRNTVGSAGPADLYRWRAAIANSQAEVISASATRNQAEIELNRVLAHPLEESFALAEAQLEDPTELVGGRRILVYFDNPFSFRVFREFMAQEALDRSPELRIIRAQIAAARRQLEGFERNLFLPTVALSASLTHNFLNVGGSNPQETPDIPGIDPTTLGSGIDAFDFQVALNLSLPLYSGGERYANIRRASAQIAQLEDIREATELRVEQRIRAQLHGVGARYAAVGLTREAAEASQQNLDLVARSYAEGATTIITLIDAQNQALISRLAGANAVYDFLIQVFEVQRAAGSFALFSEDAIRDEFLDRLRTFAEERGVRLPQRTPGAPRGFRDRTRDDPDTGRDPDEGEQQ